MHDADPEYGDLSGYLPANPGGRSKSRLIIAGSALGVLAVAAVAVFAGLRPGAANGTQASHANPAVTRLTDAVRNVPQHAIDAAARNATMPFGSMPARVSGAPLTKNGKPEVFYVGAQFCPYCAPQNWALVVALSRFGTFTGLTTIRTGNYPPFPPLDTWAFYGSSYASEYLAFVPVEQRSNVLVSPSANPGKGASYRVLQKLTPAQRAIFNKYDSGNAVPFIDFGNKVVLLGTGASPSTLEHMTWSQIAAALARPAGAPILTAADFIIANICQLTGNRPASACTADIRSLELPS